MSAVTRGRARATSWLVGSPTDRARFRDMHERFSAAPVYGLLVGGSNCVAAFVFGWHLLVLVGLASLTMVWGLRASAGARTPEAVAAATFALLELNLACSVLVTGGADSPLLPLTLVPLFTQAVCFRPVVTRAWSVTVGALVVVTSVAAAALPTPPPSPLYLHLVVYLALLGCLGLAAHHMADSDSSARGTASLDALTGLFNRRALTNHFADTRARVDVRNAPVGLTMLDIDHFKAVNDTYGHERGDRVLQQVARRLSEVARAGDMLYRVGGEEFLVLSPGADAAACAQIAERLRAAIRAEPVCGLSLTISAGVCSAPAAGASLQAMARSADDALYAAKRAGRDQVAVAPAQVT